MDYSHGEAIIGNGALETFMQQAFDWIVLWVCHGFLRSCVLGATSPRAHAPWPSRVLRGSSPYEQHRQNVHRFLVLSLVVHNGAELLFSRRELLHGAVNIEFKIKRIERHGRSIPTFICSAFVGGADLRID